MTMSTKPANEARAEIDLDFLRQLLIRVTRETATVNDATQLGLYLRAHGQRLLDALAPPHPAAPADFIRMPPYTGKPRVATTIQPPAPADAGDAMRVVEALVRIGNMRCGVPGHSVARDCGASGVALDVLAAARRLLDAPPGVGERMPDDGKEWYEWVEPSGAADNSPVYLRVSRATAIGMQKASLKEGKSYESDHRALDDFVVVHWAQKVAASASAEPERAKAAETILAWLEGKTIEIGWTDDDVQRIGVWRVTGGRNDREWHQVGEGDTTREALAVAAQQPAPAASSAAEGGKRTIE